MRNYDDIPEIVPGRPVTTRDGYHLGTVRGQHGDDLVIQPSDTNQTPWTVPTRLLKPSGHDRLVIGLSREELDRDHRDPALPGTKDDTLKASSDPTPISANEPNEGPISGEAPYTGEVGETDLSSGLIDREEPGGPR